jgi:hypothetical protein
VASLLVLVDKANGRDDRTVTIDVVEAAHP